MIITDAVEGNRGWDMTEVIQKTESRSSLILKKVLILLIIFWTIWLDFIQICNEKTITVVHKKWSMNIMWSTMVRVPHLRRGNISTDRQ
jgi:hypothetical protein